MKKKCNKNYKRKKNISTTKKEIQSENKIVLYNFGKKNKLRMKFLSKRSIFLSAILFEKYGKFPMFDFFLRNSEFVFISYLISVSVFCCRVGLCASTHGSKILPVFFSVSSHLSSTKILK